MAKNVFANYVSEKLIHKATAGDKTFYNVSIPCAASTNGYGSISLSAGQIVTATKKDKTVVTGYKNLLLGKEDGIRKVSVKTKDGYAVIEMSNKEILAAIEANRAAYKATKAVATAEEVPY